MSNMNKLNGYAYATETLDNGKVRVIVEIDPSVSVKGADCVTRTVLPTYYASYTAYGIQIGDDGIPAMVTNDGENVVSTDDLVKAKAELEKLLKCTVVVHGVRKECAGTYGVPKELFSVIALPATRPESQLKAKAKPVDEIENAQ